MYRMCICVGVRDRGPGIVVIRAHLLWARNAQKVSIAGFRWRIIFFLIPMCIYQVPCNTFVTVVYIARNRYTWYVPGTAWGGYMCRMQTIVGNLDLGSDPLPGAEVLHTSGQKTLRTSYPRQQLSIVGLNLRLYRYMHPFVSDCVY